jgi:CheY-like chemotaxis protein
MQRTSSAFIALVELANPSPYAPPLLSRQSRRPRILVTDDNEASATTLAWGLEDYGCEVKACFNGREAIAMIHTFQPDAILLDLGMPVMGGLAACRIMRAELGLTDTLIIAQTAWGDLRSREETLVAGFNLHLVKPLNLDEVNREIRQRLSLRANDTN